jgi:hypothetical protein
LIAFRVSLVWSGLVLILAWGRIPVLRIVLLLLTAAAALAAQRNLGLYAVAFCLLHGGWRPATALSPGERLLRRTPAPLRAAGPWLALALTLAAGSFWVQSLVRDDFYLREGVSRRFGSGLTPAQMPLQAIDGLAAPASRRVFANLNAAAPLIGRARARLFVDGRTEAHPAADWARYRRVLGGGDDALGELEAIAPSAVVLGGAGPATTGLAGTLLRSPGWRLEALEEGGLVFLPAPADSLRLAALLAAMDRELEDGTDPDGARRADRCLAAASRWKLAGDSSRQEAWLRRGLEARPDHPTLLHNLGNLQQARGDHGGALASFEAALRMNPRLAGSALNRGASLMALRRFRGAAAAFEQAVAIDPELFQGWVNLGLARQQLGQAEASRTAFERALELRPGDERLRRFLGNRR